MSIMHWLEVMDIFLRCFSITPTKQLVIVIVSSIIITCIKMNTVITKTFSVPPTGSVWNRRVVSDTVVCLSLCYSPPLISAGRAAKCHGNITSVFLVHRCSSSFFPCANDNVIVIWVHRLTASYLKRLQARQVHCLLPCSVLSVEADSPRSPGDSADLRLNALPSNRGCMPTCFTTLNGLE